MYTLPSRGHATAMSPRRNDMTTSPDPIGKPVVTLGSPQSSLQRVPSLPMISATNSEHALHQKYVPMGGQLDPEGHLGEDPKGHAFQYGATILGVRQRAQKEA